MLITSACMCSQKYKYQRCEVISSGRPSHSYPTVATCLNSSPPAFWDIKKLRTSTIDAAQESHLGLPPQENPEDPMLYPHFNHFSNLHLRANLPFQVAARTGAPAITSSVSGMNADPGDPPRKWMVFPQNDQVYGGRAPMTTLPGPQALQGERGTYSRCLPSIWHGGHEPFVLTPIKSTAA